MKLPLPLPQPRTRLLVCGKTGSGKSSQVKEALRHWQARGVRALVLDPCDEYSKHGRETGLVRLGPCRARVTAAELARRPELVTAARLSLAVVPDGPDARAWARAALLVMRVARHAGRCLVTLDEVGTWTDSSLHPACHQAKAELVALATNGRHTGLALVLVAQRAAQVPASARAQATDVWAFLQDAPADVAALAERIGTQAEGVTRLPLGECIEWRDTPPPAAQAAS